MQFAVRSQDSTSILLLNGCREGKSERGRVLNAWTGYLSIYVKRKEGIAAFGYPNRQQQQGAASLGAGRQGTGLCLRIKREQKQGEAKTTPTCNVPHQQRPTERGHHTPAAQPPLAPGTQQQDRSDRIEPRKIWGFAETFRSLLPCRRRRQPASQTLKKN